MIRLTIPTAASLQLVPSKEVDASTRGEAAVAQALFVLEEKLVRLKLAQLSLEAQAKGSRRP